MLFSLRKLDSQESRHIPGVIKSDLMINVLLGQIKANNKSLENGKQHFEFLCL